MELTLDNPNDAEAMKARVRAQWDGAAEGWDRHEASIGRWLDDATAAMIDLAGIAPGASVLDLAAGNGAQSVEIAKRVGVSGRVVATDLSPASVEIAERRLGALAMDGASAMVADIEALSFESGTFDAATCRLGLMFLPRPSVGLAEMRRVLRPGGRAVSVVFSGPERNPCITTLMRVATANAGIAPPEPARPGGLLSLGAPGLLARLYREAGFSRVHELARLDPVPHAVGAILCGLRPGRRGAGRRDPVAPVRGSPGGGLQPDRAGAGDVPDEGWLGRSKRARDRLGGGIDAARSADARSCWGRAASSWPEPRRPSPKAGQTPGPPPWLRSARMPSPASARLRKRFCPGGSSSSPPARTTNRRAGRTSCASPARCCPLTSATASGSSRPPITFD